MSLYLPYRTDCISTIAQVIFNYFSDIQLISDSLKYCYFFFSRFCFSILEMLILFYSFAFLQLAWSWWNQPASHIVLENSQKCMGNSGISSCVQDAHRWHFEIVTSAAALIRWRFARITNGVHDQSARRSSNGGCALTCYHTLGSCLHTHQNPQDALHWHHDLADFGVCNVLQWQKLNACSDLNRHLISVTAKHYTQVLENIYLADQNINKTTLYAFHCRKMDVAHRLMGI